MICQHCGKHPANLTWVGEGGALEYLHGGGERWCEWCAVDAQLTFARARAADIPRLEAKLAALGPQEEEETLWPYRAT